MSTERHVYIAGASRTAIGSFGGALLDCSPVLLGSVAGQAALERSGLPANAVDEVIMGNVLGAGHGMNIARQVAIKAGLPAHVPAYTVNKVCGSGLKAVTLAAAAIGSGEASVILAGGTESMSQSAFVARNVRWGQRMGNTELLDLMLSDGLTDAFGGCHMGITAENLAEKYGIARSVQDQFAFASQERAQAAIAAEHFKAEISAVPLFKRGVQSGSFEIDEYPRKGVTLDSLGSLKPAFKKDGTVTAGNASGINDGAAALLLSANPPKGGSGVPIAKILGWASAGVEPGLMGIGPVPAVKKLLQQTGVALSAIDLIEANEAFAVQALAVSKELELDPSRVNVCGGAIALGHPIGASGARILVTLLYQLQRLKKSLGLATLCVGGGQGIAVLIEQL